MLQLFKNRTNRRYNLPELYPPLPVFHISRIRSICTEKKITRIKYEITDFKSKNIASIITGDADTRGLNNKENNNYSSNNNSAAASSVLKSL